MADSVILEFPSEYRFLNMVDLLCVELVGEMGFPPEAQNEISISVIEACTNSLEHGNKCCPERNVRVVMTMFPDRFQVEAFDHGEGFDFDEYMKHIPDPADIAHLFRYLDLKEQRILFNLIGNAEKSAYVLAELDHVTGAQLLQTLDKETITEVLQEMPSDDAADIIGNMPEELADEILNIMHDDDSDEIEHLLQYDEDSAGGIMSTEVFTLEEDVTVKEAIEAIQQADDVEMVFYLSLIHISEPTRPY